MLVNNPGMGIVGAFEATPMAAVHDVIATNTFGPMALVQAALTAESLNGKLRDELLNREWFRSRAEAMVLIECWR